MTSSLTLSLPEIALFLSAAIVLGITIRLFIGMRSNMKAEAAADNFVNDEWKTKYMSEIQRCDKEIAAMNEKLRQSGDHVKTLSTKAEELRWQHRRFEAIKEQLEKELNDLDRKNKLHLVAIQEKKGLVASGQ
jgi:predicted RNase H-like nuclease (RuvC/YqgF family)